MYCHRHIKRSMLPPPIDKQKRKRKRVKQKVSKKGESCLSEPLSVIFFFKMTPEPAARPWEGGRNKFNFKVLKKGLVLVGLWRDLKLSVHLVHYHFSLIRHDFFFFFRDWGKEIQSKVLGCLVFVLQKRYDCVFNLYFHGAWELYKL